MASPALGQRPTPTPGTVESWCWAFIHSIELECKLDPGEVPLRNGEPRWEPDPPARRVSAPGRPRELVPIQRAPRTPKAAALAQPRARAHLFHTFLHHELQAAELFAWAILAFPETPGDFRSGLLRLCREELAHLALYRGHLHALGFHVGDFPVRDWFWERVARVPDPLTFVSLLGLGLEGANLEHSSRFAGLFRSAGDLDGTNILERVERDEIGHVAFARRWFEHWTEAPLEYERWRAALPAPLTPAVLRGQPLNRAARMRAGLDADFLDRLDAEPTTTSPSPR